MTIVEKARKIRKKCQHYPFRRLREFEDWMVPKMREHLDLGGSFNSFAGQNGINIVMWSKIYSSSPELLAMREEYTKRMIEKGRVSRFKLRENE